MLRSNVSNRSSKAVVKAYTRGGDDILFNLSHGLKTTKSHESVRHAQHSVNRLICLTQVLFNGFKNKLHGSSDELAEVLNGSSVALDFVLLATRGDAAAG
jgi:hypothetical protein